MESGLFLWSCGKLECGKRVFSFCGLVGNLSVESGLFLCSCGKHFNCDTSGCVCDSVGYFNCGKTGCYCDSLETSLILKKLVVSALL